MRTSHMLAAAASAFALMAGTAAAETTATASTELNIRSGPGPQFEVVGVIPAEGSVRLVDCGADGQWCRIEHDGTEGWASGGYLSVEQENEQVVIVERRQDITVPVVEYENHAPEQATLGLGSGAALGALMGGPVGAAIGGATGAALGALANIPEPVVDYVRVNRTETVYLDGEVVVGAEVPETVELQTVPDSEYRFTTINGVPVVIEPDGRRIVHLVR
jgi:uncharacterized protein YraI